MKFGLWVLFWASVSLAWFAASGDANAAAADSIRASSFGVKIANALRGLGWPDEAVVFALATLPVIELRGAIPVGYWLQLTPVMLTVLAVLGLVLKLFCNFALPQCALSISLSVICLYVFGWIRSSYSDIGAIVGDRDTLLKTSVKIRAALFSFL